MFMQAVFCFLLVSQVAANGPTSSPEPSEVAFIRSHLGFKMTGVMGIPDITQKLHLKSGFLMVKGGKYSGLNSLQVRNAHVTPIQSDAATPATPGRTAIAAAPRTAAAAAPKTETPVIVEFELSFNDISVVFDEFFAKKLKFFKASGQWKAGKVNNLFKITVTLHPRDGSSLDCRMEVNKVAVIDFAFKSYSINCRKCFWMFLSPIAKMRLKHKIQAALAIEIVSFLQHSLSNTPLFGVYRSCSR